MNNHTDKWIILPVMNVIKERVHGAMRVPSRAFDISKNARTREVTFKPKSEG